MMSDKTIREAVYKTQVTRVSDESEKEEDQKTNDKNKKQMKNKKKNKITGKELKVNTLMKKPNLSIETPNSEIQLLRTVVNEDENKNEEKEITKKKKPLCIRIIREAFCGHKSIAKSIFLALFSIALLSLAVTIIWLTTFIIQTQTIQTSLRNSIIQRTFGYTQLTMGVPRTYIGTFAGAWPDEYSNANVTDFEKVWRSIWDSFNAGMYEFEHHVHYSFYYKGGQKMIGIMGGAHEKHPIIINDERGPGELKEGEVPLHNEGFDHSSILRFRVWPNLTKTGYLEGNDVINKTNGQVGKLTLNMTYEQPDHYKDIEKEASNLAHKRGWTKTHLWFCTNPEIDCMHMTGYYEIVRSMTGEFLGYHYMSYETAGLSSLLSSYQDISEISFIFEGKTGNMIASSNAKTHPTYYFDKEGKSHVYTIQNYNHHFVRLVAPIIPQKFGNQLENTILHDTVDVPGYGRAWVDVTHLTDEWGLDWWLVVVSSQFSLLAFPAFYGSATVGFSLCLILGAIVAGIVLSITIHRPLSRIASDMNKVEKMNLNEIKLPRHYSTYDEIQQLEDAFRMMINKLKSYRAFLPQAILDNTSDEFDDLVPAEVNSEVDSNSVTSSCSVQSNRSKMKNTPGSLLPRSRSSIFAPKLEVKEINIMCVRIFNYSTILGHANKKHFIHLHGDYLANISAVCMQNGGKLERFNHELFLFTFSSTIKACMSSFKIVKRLKLLNNIQENKDNGLRFDFGIGICKEKVLQGVLGNDEIRQRTLFGKALELSKQLADTNRVWSTHILVNEACQEAMEKNAITRPVSKIKLSYSPTEYIAYELMHAVEVKYDEWFYELQQKSQLNAYDIYRDAFNAMLEERYTEAQHQFLKFRESYPDDHVVQKMIKKCTANIIKKAASGLSLNIRSIYHRHKEIDSATTPIDKNDE